jgi:hypothetical protein
MAAETRSDAYDWLAPQLGQFFSPSPPSPTTFPLTTTHLLLILLPPSLLLPLLPSWTIPYILLPMGWVPPLIFHPNLTSAIIALPRHPLVLKCRQMAEHFALLDTLSDELGRKEIARVEVWENERLDPSIASKPLTTPAIWGSRFLRAGERAPWVKVYGEDSKWMGLGQGSLHAGASATSSSGSGANHRLGNSEANEKDGVATGEGEVTLALQDQWKFIPGEDWRVDKCGLWSNCGTDEGKCMHESWLFLASRSRCLTCRWVDVYGRLVAGKSAEHSCLLRDLAITTEPFCSSCGYHGQYDRTHAQGHEKAKMVQADLQGE